MASVQRRTQNGQVRWVVRHRMPDGTQRSRSFIRQRDAQQYRTTVAGDTLAGTIADPRLSKTRFADVAATWQAGRVSLRDTTRAAERSRLESLVLPTFGTYPIGAIEPSDVQTWIAGLDAQGYSAATIAKAYRIVRAVCKVAVRDGKVARSPVESGIELPKATTTPMMVLTTDEIAALADAVGPFWRPLILTAAGTGMRWGELAGLRTERVDLLRRKIEVVEQLTEVSGRHSFTQPKTASAVRSVTLPAYLADEIGTHIGQHPNSRGVVFASTEGAYLRRSNFGRGVFKPAARSIEKPTLRFHDLRHSHASILLAAGEPITTVAARLGHRDPSITLRVYSHLMPGQDQSAADRLDTLWRGINVGYPSEAEVVELPGTVAL